MLRWRKGDSQLTLKPYVFSGEQDFEDNMGGLSTRIAGEFKGWGAGGSYSRGLGERWAIYGFAIGTVVSDGNFAISKPGGETLKILDGKSSFQLVSVGFSRKYYATGEKGFTLPVFFGVLLQRVRFEQRVQEFRDPGAGGALYADFDMNATALFPGVMAGAQAGFDLGERFQLNPFFVAGATSLNFDYTNANIRVNTGAARSTLDKGLSGGEYTLESGFFVSGGMNLVYRPWGLAVNVTAPIVKKLLLAATEDVDIAMFSVSKSFGSYPR